MISPDPKGLGLFLNLACENLKAKVGKLQESQESVGRCGSLLE